MQASGSGQGGAIRSFQADAHSVAWGKPLPEKCPECGGSYLIEKFLKSGAFAQCPNAECKFKKPLPQQAPAEAPVEVQA